MREHEPGLWHHWDTAAFAAAQRANRPVLLFLHTRWSAGSRHAAHSVFTDPAIVSRLRAAVVAIEVDADRRPDIAERYTIDGWPTVALLTPYGDLLSAAPALDAPRLALELDRTAAAWQRDHARLAAAARRARAARQAAAGDRTASALLDENAPERVAALLDDDYDERHGGFGRVPRGPQEPAVRFCLGPGAGHPIWEARARQTLDGLTLPAVDASGAFPRAVLTADWHSVDDTVLVDVQAERIRLCLDAGQMLNDDRLLARARAALEVVHRRLEDPVSGGYRLHEGDPAIFTDANARMARAALQASAVFREARWGEAAIRALERVVPAVYARGAGVAHVLEGQPRIRGLLTDQVHTAAALVDAADATGIAPYRELAEELLRSGLRRYRDPLTGGLLDRVRTAAGAGDVGLLGEPLRPFLLNCEAARLLARLGRDTGQPELLGAAREVLASQTEVYLSQGALAPEYVFALAEVVRSG